MYFPSSQRDHFYWLVLLGDWFFKYVGAIPRHFSVTFVDSFYEKHNSWHTRLHGRQVMVQAFLFLCLTACFQ